MRTIRNEHAANLAMESGALSVRAGMLRERDHIGANFHKPAPVRTGHMHQGAGRVFVAQCFASMAAALVVIL